MRAQILAGCVLLLSACSGIASESGSSGAGAAGISSSGAAGHASAGATGAGGHASAGAAGSASSGGSAGTGSTPKPCGGFVGSTCSDQEYCAYMPGQACGAADASATCLPRPQACTDIFMPVCGCDQKTYSSDCDAASNGQGVLSLGACP